MGQKEALQLFEDKKIRTSWSEEDEKWYFSIVDVVGALTDQPTSKRASTYWSVLKTRLKEEGAEELLTNCKRLKMLSADGKHHPTVVVPLNSIALEIVEKYRDLPGDSLLPFISEQNYNDNIKAAFTVAGITRLVTELDPVSRKEVKRPLNEVASSHLARRTFAGNIYRQVKDPNLVASLTGHAEGSRAFNRYREIDLGMKQDLVKILENKK